ncbi:MULTISPECIES: Hsp20/alpha crystallin family protein [Methanothrix]|jgi:HSP20 family molecular chaperone IbpA|uniref:Hsp20/alpha crystallin family protein n=1 Tax=Methanothrix TaxID=2222 RepID=UPI0023F0ADBC|nr:Hsp20/alpha crystallin family protein [Methanothrix sp.]MCK9406125.1 Hsp20/alpha crystallin family protein [Methanothrix sp.]MCK9585438.1 Hsp20/alpha crystallin family protein [Methanothrix soehngenii]MDD5734073.1 Hsp20/alpha crystallin family protein [Methanothrix soehngenii]
MVEESKDKDASKENLDAEKITRLEKRIEELETGFHKQREDIQMGGIVQNVVSQFIPGLGGIIKSLEDSSPEFRQRIADTDAEIKHRIDVGWSSKPVVDYHVSTRPLSHGPRRAAPRTENVNMPTSAPHRQPIVDVMEGKDGITIIAELPGVSEEDLLMNLEGDSLEITAGQFSKKIVMPRPAKSIIEKRFKNGILHLKLD